MKYTGLIMGSRTLDYAALLAALGVVQQALPQLQEQLGGYYGYVFMIVGAAVAYLRQKTSTPIGGEK